MHSDDKKPLLITHAPLGAFALPISIEVGIYHWDVERAGFRKRSPRCWPGPSTTTRNISERCPACRCFGLAACHTVGVFRDRQLRLRRPRLQCLRNPGSPTLQRVIAWRLPQFDHRILTSRYSEIDRTNKCFVTTSYAFPYPLYTSQSLDPVLEPRNLGQRFGSDSTATL